MTWQAGVRDCSDFYPAADVSHGRGHIRTSVRTILPSSNFLFPGVESILMPLAASAPAQLGKPQARLQTGAVLDLTSAN
jgi:hypothetical protein